MTGAAARGIADFTIGASRATNSWRKSYQRLNVSGSSESMCAPLVNVNHFWVVPVNLPDELGAVAAGLLVLPLAGHERRAP